jgi:hypothetical protein
MKIQSLLLKPSNNMIEFINDVHSIGFESWENDITLFQKTWDNVLKTVRLSTNNGYLKKKLINSMSWKGNK